MNVKYYLDYNEQLNENEIVSEFINLYYTNISTKNLFSVINLFDINAKCIYNDKEYIGIHNVYSSHMTEGINKIIYDKIAYTSTVIDNLTLLIQVSGNCQGIYFWNQKTKTRKFVETFIINYSNEQIIVSNYILKFVD